MKVSLIILSALKIGKVSVIKCNPLYSKQAPSRDIPITNNISEGRKRYLFLVKKAMIDKIAIPGSVNLCISTVSQKLLRKLKSIILHSIKEILVSNLFLNKLSTIDISDIGSTNVC